MPQTTSPDNIVYPVSADQGSNLPSVLATMAGSMQTALTNLRNSITSITSVNTVTQAAFGTVASGHTVAFFGLRQSGKVVSGSLRIEKTSGALVHAGTVFTVNTAYRPAHGQLMPLAGVHSGGGVSATSGGAMLTSAGEIKVYTPGTATVAEIGLSWIIP